MKRIFLFMALVLLAAIGYGQTSSVLLRGDTIKVFKKNDTSNLKVDSNAYITGRAVIGKAMTNLSSASLNLTDTTRAIKLNEMYSRTRVVTPANGMLVYEDSVNKFLKYEAGAWSVFGGAGTVTSVATNNGSGITGGTITGAGTLAIDTSVIATQYDLTQVGGSAPILPSTLIAFGNGTDPYTSSADFVYDVAGTFKSVFTAGNDTRLIQDDVNQILTYQKGADVYLSLDIANNRFQVGDINVTLTGTKIDIDDNNRTITLNGGAAGDYLISNFNAQTIYIGQSTTFLYADVGLGVASIGDYIGAANNTFFGVKDASQLATFQKGADVYFSTTVATGTETGFWGNPGGNATSVAWDDAASTITLNADASLKYGSASDVYLSLDIANELHQMGGLLSSSGFMSWSNPAISATEMGDVNNNGNATIIYLHDVDRTIRITSSSAMALEIDFVNAIYSIGDLLASGNSTKGVFDDANGLIKLSSGGQDMIFLDNLNQTSYIYARGAPSSSIQLWSNSEMFYNETGDTSSLHLDYQTADGIRVQAGDWQNLVNGTKMVIRDAAETITLKADNGILVNTGIIRGDALHDNAFGQGDATQQDVRSGTYTGTVTASTNTDIAVTVTQAQWSRVGNVVTVSGRFTADPTTTTLTTSFELSLPVASNVGAVSDLSGTAFCGNIVSMGGEITGVVANDTAIIFWKASDVTSQTWSFTFTYEIL